jgi:hypothetical protein
MLIWMYLYFFNFTSCIFLLNTADASLEHFNSLTAHSQVTFKLNTLFCKMHAVKFHMVLIAT